MMFLCSVRHFFCWIVTVGLCVAAMSVATPALAVNWFMLQGVESENAPKFRFGGFALFDYQNSGGGDLPAGPFKGQPMASGLVSPDMNSSAESNLRKLRLGVRGALTDQFSYSFKTISGNNSVTGIDKGNRLRIVESSVTINAIPHARIRIGLIKAPGAEESLGFVPPCYYINLTGMTNMLMQERFFEADGQDPTQENNPLIAGCCRDIGVMVFDAFHLNQWELSYAVMLANGSGMRLNDNNRNPEGYVYLSAEYLFGAGRRVHREGWKFFSWYQEGQRTLDVGLDHDEHEFHRSRYGVGTALLWRKFRFGGEIIKADGMIFSGTDFNAPAGTVSTDGLKVSSFNIRPEDQGLGWYVDFGYRVLPNFWLNARYDRLDLNTETMAEKEFETVTLGVLWQVSRHIWAKANYEFRHACAPDQQTTSVVNQILDDLPDRFSAQLLYLF